MSKRKSLLQQNDDLKKKWGGDTLNYDIQSAIKNYDNSLAEYNNAATTADRKAVINSMYGGDITKWNKDTAYDEYMNDLNFINRVDSLNQGYTGAMDAAQKAESRAMQYADTRRQLMQKYIPETLLAQGVANTGYTADALLKAENNYNQYVMGAMSDRANAEQNALQSYQDALQTYKMDKAAKDYETFKQQQDKYAQFKTNAIDWIENGADMDYIKQQASAMGITDTKELEDYYNSMLTKAQTEVKNALLRDIDNLTFEQIEAELREGNISETMANELKGELGKDEFTATDAIFNEDGSKIRNDKNDRFSVTYNGKKYRFMTGGQVGNDEKAKKYAKAAQLKDGTVFSDKNGKLYIYKNGNVYIIQTRLVYNKKDYQQLTDALDK
jgi:hypothetical protein